MSDKSVDENTRDTCTIGNYWYIATFVGTAWAVTRRALDGTTTEALVPKDFNSARKAIDAAIARGSWA
jgi:hypothetical protein